MFLSRLSPDGILRVSRWYHSERPDEIYRLTALPSASILVPPGIAMGTALRRQAAYSEAT